MSVVPPPTNAIPQSTPPTPSSGWVQVGPNGGWDWTGNEADLLGNIPPGWFVAANGFWYFRPSSDLPGKSAGPSAPLSSFEVAAAGAALAFALGFGGWAVLVGALLAYLLSDLIQALWAALAPVLRPIAQAIGAQPFTVFLLALGFLIYEWRK